MPVWHKLTKPWVKSDKLVVLAVTQEQHPARCRLFAQWKQIKFPILHDPITVLGTKVVPLFVAIDEHGIVRQTRARTSTFERTFLNQKFTDDAKGPVATLTPSADLKVLEGLVKEKQTARIWKDLGDARLLWGEGRAIDKAIDAYRQALALNPKDGATMFSLGVCYRRRYELKDQQSTDFQAAADYWRKALASDPNQYIWRRRIQQYGPRLDKPYPFYDWVATARKDIQARGEKPEALRVALLGAEIAQPSRRFTSVGPGKAPDPMGKINRDTGFIQHEVTTVSGTGRAGRSARVHLTFYPNAKKKVHWNNEGEPLTLWLKVPEGWEISQQLLKAKQPKQATSLEKRSLDFEIRAPRGATGTQKISGYALYNVCEDVDGTCVFLRKDFTIEIKIQ